MSIASLVKSLNSGEISFDQFTEMSQLVCIESAAAASVLGQAVIPVPILGAVLGTIAGRIVIDFSKKYFAKETEGEIVWVTNENRYNTGTKSLQVINHKYCRIL